mmetsp:Transcript_8555/g.20762  ORF Transcript_8555/g.20762 Transcript_8555/m.20762 type:complete len:206 (+) Transcript_8555:528-1145(+)
MMPTTHSPSRMISVCDRLNRLRHTQKKKESDGASLAVPSWEDNEEPPPGVVPSNVVPDVAQEKGELRSQADEEDEDDPPETPDPATTTPENPMSPFCRLASRAAAVWSVAAIFRSLLSCCSKCCAEPSAAVDAELATPSRTKRVAEVLLSAACCISVSLCVRKVQVRSFEKKTHAVHASRSLHRFPQNSGPDPGGMLVSPHDAVR